MYTEERKGGTMPARIFKMLLELSQATPYTYTGVI
jgi:hypothetical protein